MTFPPLHGIRVLELCDRWGELAGRILSELGATVLKVEPPDGAPARFRPPLGNELDARMSSLYWEAVGAGKNSLVLDLGSTKGVTLVSQLAETADVLIESHRSGHLASVGLGYGALSKLNPRLVYCSITPYGSEGPKADWPATELTVEAAGGRMSVQGDRDRPPLPVGYPQADFHASAQAAADIAIALVERQRSGAGQRLDTSAQAAVAWTLLGAGAYPAATGQDPPAVKRVANLSDAEEEAPMMRPFPRLVAASDGFAVVGMGPGDNSRMLTLIMKETHAQGRLDPRLAEVDWDSWSLDYQEGRLDQTRIEIAVEQARDWFRSKSRRELVEWAYEQDLRLGPVNSTKDVVASDQLSARDFWTKGTETALCRFPAKLSRTPARDAAAAPAFEPNAPSGTWPETASPPTSVASGRVGEAFAGLKVVDFSWVAVGPTIARALADHGATVVKVESTARLDLARRLPPYKDRVPGVNRSQWFGTFNTSKLSVALNLSSPQGRTLARKLIAWADVVIESYSPGTMKRLGLDYETVSGGHDDLIMLSTSMMGQTGPLAAYAGYGQQASAFAGIHGITGWPDRPPCGPFGPYTDAVAPKWGIAALAAALYERNYSGLGQHIDLSQCESGVRFIEPLLLDEAANGRTAAVAGLSSSSACPHGVYETKGASRFIAIAVESREQWRALVKEANLSQFADPELDDLGVRTAYGAHIDEQLRIWTAGFDPFELEARLAAAGVPAAVVQWPSDLHRDAQLKYRGFYEPLEHAEMGVIPYETFATTFSTKKERLHGPAPCVGQHTELVLSQLLGMSDSDISELAAEGVLE